MKYIDFKTVKYFSQKKTTLMKKEGILIKMIGRSLTEKVFLITGKIRNA